ncbi:hypothetical protein A2662_00580 [Candidatus Giovannonibacteria bacterium RIFCSPHIGHO2_01_FULL_45_33]|nr:MAG: hypothetical protein A2662_00580 [Candidatus Giovannonibacteria bacterium RIFCSPHIGHO2_01_FULL_45_33]OGF69803.1 MAG: hypothetical protein A3C73_03445 [Candidatus Giovannonibacteria bacterium RIFCSPHIGHO2_02_FULL_44_11]
MLKFLVILLLTLLSGSPVESAVTEEDCAKDADCVNYYAELGNKNFEILREIRNRYVNEIGFEKLVTAFRKGGMQEVFSLLDPHSDYFTASVKAGKEEANKSFGGVGIRMRVRNGKVFVFALVKDSPAMRSGEIKKGDFIIAVGDNSAEDVKSDVVSGWIRGELGTDVVLKMRRGRAEFFVTLKRELIKPAVFPSVVIGSAGYIYLPKFEKGTAGKTEKISAFDRINKAISEFPPSVNGLVLDLRDNPGGSLNEAGKVSAIFLELDQYIVRVVQRNGVYHGFGASYRGADTKKIGLPMVVLIDELSASASEIVASALQDNKRAVIIGMPSFGKASSQSVYGCDDENDYWKELLEGDCFILTTGRVYRARGRTLQAKGVIPDIVVDGGGDDIEKMTFELAISEQTIAGHLTGEEEGELTPDEKSRFSLLKEDRQLYVALEVLKILSGKEKL